MKTSRRKWSLWLPFLLVVVFCLSVVASGWLARHGRRRSYDCVPRDANSVLVTGYCNCGKCCGWRKSWFGFGPPVYNYGPMAGKRKEVGITANGSVAKHGTIAADPRVYKFGTVLNIPGYGVGTVEDVGGAIKGRHIDIWFPTHAEAQKWGARWLKVTELPKR